MKNKKGFQKTRQFFGLKLTLLNKGEKPVEKKYFLENVAFLLDP